MGEQPTGTGEGPPAKGSICLGGTRGTGDGACCHQLLLAVQPLQVRRGAALHTCLVLPCSAHPVAAHYIHPNTHSQNLTPAHTPNILHTPSTTPVPLTCAMTSPSFSYDTA